MYVADLTFVWVNLKGTMNRCLFVYVAFVVGFSLEAEQWEPVVGEHHVAQICRSERTTHGDEDINRAKRLLRQWCDALVAYQVKAPKDPRVMGAMLCPACAIQHGRICDAVYPLSYMWKQTGKPVYLEAARDAVAWSRFNLTDMGGGRLHNDFQGQW